MSSLMGKKQSLSLKNRRVEAFTWGPSSGLDKVPSSRSQPLSLDPSFLTNTGSPGRGFQALFLPARPHESLQAPTCSCPARLLCLSWSVQAAGLGASWASHALLSAACSLGAGAGHRPGAAAAAAPPVPGVCLHSLQGQGDWFCGCSQPGAAQSNTPGIPQGSAAGVPVRAGLTGSPEAPLLCLWDGELSACSRRNT